MISRDLDPRDVVPSSLRFHVEGLHSYYVVSRTPELKAQAFPVNPPLCSPIFSIPLLEVFTRVALCFLFGPAVDSLVLPAWGPALPLPKFQGDYDGLRR